MSGVGMMSFSDYKFVHAPSFSSSLEARSQLDLTRPVQIFEQACYKCGCYSHDWIGGPMFERMKAAGCVE